MEMDFLPFSNLSICSPGFRAGALPLTRHTCLPIALPIDGRTFGSTVEFNGQKALDGFEALRDLDSNEDGVFDASDAQFGNVRVWRDLNQDGVSQEGELFTLDELNIAGINLSATVQTVNLGNGNQQTAQGTFTRTDGSTGTVANLNFIDNPFYREFGDSVTLAGACCAVSTISKVVQ